MRQFLFLLSIICLATLGVSAQQTQKDKKVKLPRGIVIKDNQLTVSDKYLIEKTDKGAQIMYRKRNGGGLGTTGVLNCDCASGNGGCSLDILGGGAKCGESGCQKCDMVVIINSSKRTTTIQ